MQADPRGSYFPVHDPRTRRPAPGRPGLPPASATPYTVYVASESADLVTRIEVGPGGWRKVREIPVGILPTDPDGPTTSRSPPTGAPGSVDCPWHALGLGLEVRHRRRHLLGRAGVGMFPTTVGLSPDGEWAFIPNSDFHGDRGHQNSISVLFTRSSSRSPRSRPATCPRLAGEPCGNRGVYRMHDVGRAGYDRSVDVRNNRRVTAGERTPDERRGTRQDGRRSKARRGEQHPAGPEPRLSGDLRQRLPDDQLVYVACNHSNDVQVRDATTFELVRRLPPALGPTTSSRHPTGAGCW
jgi:hypothetical protein